MNTPPDQPQTECLFIGGPADGQRAMVPDSRPTVEWLDERGGSSTYRKELLGAPGKTWRVFVHHPVPMTTAMDMLLAGYRTRP